MTKKLGKGLASLFKDNYINDDISSENAVNIDMSKLVPNPYQPRKVFELSQLEELRDSIKEHGIITPIIVVFKDQKYAIVTGERRFRAAKMAGVEQMPAIIREYTDNQMMEIALLENIQREDLTPIEIAESYRSLIKHLNVTQEQLANKMGKSRSQITNMLGLLTLPQEVQNLVNEAKISMGHARVLSKLNSKEEIITLAKEIVSKKLSVREVEALSRSETKRIPLNFKKPSFDYSAYKTILETHLNTKVLVKKGVITIKYGDLSSLEKIIEQICN